MDSREDERYRYFEGAWRNLPDFSKVEVKKTGTVEKFDLSIRDQNDNFGIVFSGYLKIAEKGEIYTYCPADGNWSRIPKSMLYRRK